MTTQPFDQQPAIQMWELEFNFGDRIRKARRVLGLTVEQLAATLGVKKQVVSQWETGVSNPRAPFAIARRVEYVYGIPAWWMLGNDEPPAGETDEGPERARRDSNPQPSDVESNVVDVDFGADFDWSATGVAGGLAEVLAFPGRRS